MRRNARSDWNHKSQWYLYKTAKGPCSPHSRHHNRSRRPPLSPRFNVDRASRVDTQGIQPSYNARGAACRWLTTAPRDRCRDIATRAPTRISHGISHECPRPPATMLSGHDSAPRLDATDPTLKRGCREIHLAHGMRRRRTRRGGSQVARGGGEGGEGKGGGGGRE